MKGWQLGAVVAGLIIMMVAFGILFKPDSTGGPIIVAPNSSGQLAPVTTPTPADQQEKTVKGSGSTFVGRDTDGKISWTLKCTSILMRDTVKKADARDITCTFYSKQQQPVATVTARGCTVNLTNNNMQFVGRVSAFDPMGQTLTVEHLRYDGKARRFYGHGGVRMTRATSVLVGDKVWADPNLKIVEITGHVQAFVRSLALNTPAPVPPPTVPPLPRDEPSPSTSDGAGTPRKAPAAPQSLSRPSGAAHVATPPVTTIPGSESAHPLGRALPAATPRSQ